MFEILVYFSIHVPFVTSSCNTFFLVLHFKKNSLLVTTTLVFQRDSKICLRFSTNNCENERYDLVHDILKKHRLLVVQDRIWPPDAIVRNADHSNSSEFRGVPFQMMVGPDLRHPTVGCQYLVLLVLQ